VWKLNGREKLALMVFAPRIQALDTLKEKAGSLNHEAVLDLAIKAGFSRAAAEKLSQERLKAKLRAGDRVE
jgi:hypothetical protein